MSTENLQTEAAAWLVRCEGEGCTAEDRAGLETWLAANPHHRAVYMRLRAAWRQADQFRRLRPFDASVDENLLTGAILPSLKRPDRPTALRFTSKGLRFAAGAAALLVAVAFVAQWIVKRSEWQTYTTEVGGFQRAVLGDGSTVHLNTDTRIVAHITQTRREVVLDRGEALFNVALDPRRTFEVQARGTTIRALGTVFSVRLRKAKGVDVLVTDGQVTIASPEREIKQLTQGETAMVRDSRLQVAKADAVQVKRKIAWMTGRLLFEQQTLAEMAQEFNRYNRRQLLIDDPAIAELRMSAGFDATDPESFVSALASAYGIRALHSGADDTAIIRLVGAE